MLERIKALLRRRHQLRIDLLSRHCIERGDLSRASPIVPVTYGAVETLKFDLQAALGRDLHHVSGRWPSCYRLEGSYVAEFPEAHLVGPNALPISASRQIIVENFFGATAFILRHDPVASLARSFYPVGRAFECAFSIVGPYTSNYFHWIIDSLTQLQAYEAYRQETGRACQLILPSHLRSWQLTSLEQLGYPPETYIRWDPKWGHASVRTLVVASSRRMRHHDTPGTTAEDSPASPSACAWLRSRLLPAAKDANGASSRRNYPARVVISRRSAIKGSRIGNEPEIVAWLERYGFQPVDFAEVDFTEQVRLVAAAECVVATHGAGLTNLVFAHGAKVLEILPTNSLRRDFFAIAAAVQCPYRAIIVSPDASGLYLVERERIEQELSFLGVT